MKTLFIYCLLALPLLCQAQSDAAQLRKGNEAYGKGEYDIAEQYYQRAAGGKYAPQAAFNTAAAQYQRQQYEQAAQLFEQTAQSLPPEQRANAHYNAGNALLKAGKLDESIAAYKNALRQNPNNADAKYNLAYAQKMKKQQQQQNQDQQNQDQQDQNKEGQDQQQGKDGQNSQDQQQQNQDQQNQNKEEQDQQQQGKDGQNQQNQNKEGQDQQQQGKDGQDQQNQNKEGQSQQQQGKEGQNSQDPNGEMMPNSQIKRLSKQEAARLLEAMRLEELKVQQRVKQKQAQGKVPQRGGKDW
jgi:Ca-activated chloride channel family protein